MMVYSFVALYSTRAQNDCKLTVFAISVTSFSETSYEISSQSLTPLLLKLAAYIVRASKLTNNYYKGEEPGNAYRWRCTTVVIIKLTVFAILTC